MRGIEFAIGMREQEVLVVFEMNSVRIRSKIQREVKEGLKLINDKSKFRVSVLNERTDLIPRGFLKTHSHIKHP